MSHHTGFVQRGLSIQNDDVAISDVPIHLLIPCRWTQAARSPICVALRGQQLISDREPLLGSRSVLWWSDPSPNTRQPTSEVCVPSSFCTREAPGWTFDPVMTNCRSSCTFDAVTGSGKVNLRANTGGMPISFVSMLISGEMTDRAA